ncbi:protein yop1-like [Ixodes scapularis]|uniref:protein yop1-like n=1 Tax=Ixodes scapularis TaxID=6945 RepID=UPI001A9D697B|nr:protein yop1-like [Ixodes scapularis]
MAQEIGEALARLLRERGPIGSALDKFERSSRLRREYIVYGIGGIVLFMFTMNVMGAFLTQLITTTWGMLGSIRALEKREPASMQKWTSYWLIFAILNVFLGGITNLLGQYFQKIYFLKFLLLCWCACPLESNGADYLYGWILAHRLFRPLVHNMGPPKKAHAPPSQGDEKSGDVGRALPPRIEKARK